MVWQPGGGLFVVVTTSCFYTKQHAGARKHTGPQSQNVSSERVLRTRPQNASSERVLRTGSQNENLIRSGAPGDQNSVWVAGRTHGTMRSGAERKRTRRGEPDAEESPLFDGRRGRHGAGAPGGPSEAEPGGARVRCRAAAPP